VGCAANASLVAPAAVTVNALEVAPVSPELDAVSVYPAPAALMERFEKVAIPLEAATVSVPESVPPPGFAPIAIVTLAELVVTMLPFVSWTCTVTAGEIETPGATFDGWVPNATFAAAPAVTVNAVEVAPASPELAAVSV
jgi:hypothetical protein